MNMYPETFSWEIFMENNAVGWFEIYVDDMDRARSFYEKTFECHLSKVEGNGVEIDMWQFPQNMKGYGSGGAIAKMEGVRPGGNSTLVYFSCEDCGVVEMRAESAGGEIQRPKMSIGEYGFISIVKDTEGNIIGLHSLQ